MPKFNGAQVARLNGREYGLGFQPNRDPRHWMAYESPLRVEASERTSKFWNMGPIRLDQNGDSSCVGYSGSHLLANGPNTQSDIIITNETADLCYREAQKRDPWPGESYEGSSVSGFAAYAKERGWVGDYFWAYDIQTTVNMVLERGPVLVGTTWYNSMFRTLPNGVIVLNPSSGVAGGHAYLINGVSLKADYGEGKIGYFRFQNSWGAEGSPFLKGPPWGYLDKGYARIAIEDFTVLLEDDGEVLVAAEL